MRCNFQHPPEAEARFFIASERRRPHEVNVSNLGGYALTGPLLACCFVVVADSLFVSN